MQLIPIQNPKSSNQKTGPLRRTQIHRNFIGGLLVKGNYIISSSEDGELTITNATNLTKEKVLLRLSYPINHLAMSEDGELIAAASDDGKIRIFSTETWRLVQEISAHSSYVTKVAFCKGELFSISKDETIKIWNPNSGELLHTLSGHAAWVYTIAAAPNGKKLLSTGNNCGTKVWDLKSKTLEKDLVEGGQLIYGQDGTTLMFGGNNNTGIGNKHFPTSSLWIEGDMVFTGAQDLICWNPKDWSIKWQEDLSYETIKSMVHLPQYNMLIVVSDIIYGINPATGQIDFSQRNTDSTPFFSCAALGDDYLVTGDANGYISIWNLADLVSKGQKAPFGGDVYRPIYIPSVDRIIAGSWLGGVASIWSKNGRFIESFKGLPSNRDNKPIGTVPKAPHKVLMTGEGEIWVIDVAQAKIETKIALDHKDLSVTGLIWINDTEFIASITSAQPRLVNIETKEVSVISSPYNLGSENYRINEELVLLQLSFYIEKNYYQSEAPISDIAFNVGSSFKEIPQRQAPLLVYNVKTKEVVHEWWFPSHLVKKTEWGTEYAWPIAGGPNNSLIAACYTERKLVYIWQLGKAEPLLIKDLSKMARSQYSSPFCVFANEKIFVFRMDDDMHLYDIQQNKWSSFKTNGWKTAFDPEKRFMASIQNTSHLVIYDTNDWTIIHRESFNFELEWVLWDEFLYVYNKNKGIIAHQLLR